MSAVNFPFRYEQYVLNEQRLIKFINPDTNHYGLCEFIQNKIYLLTYNNKNYIIIYIEDTGFAFFYNYDDINSYFVTENNTIINKQSVPLFKYLYLIYRGQINKHQINNFFKIHFNIEFIYCTIDKVEIDLTYAKSRINELNQFLYLNCQDKYKIEIDYAYRMNNIVYYTDIDDIVDEAESIYLCLNLNNKCVSSIDFFITEKSEVKCIMITSKTMKEHEGNNYNKLLRTVTMLIASYFDVTHLYSEAHNPISALLMIRLFKNNEYDTRFTKYLNKKNLKEDDLNFDILDNYIDRREEIDIYSPINELNIQIAGQLFVKISGLLPCELNIPDI